MDLSAHVSSPAPIPEGFPLAAIDANARALERTPLPIPGFDACGYAWFDADAPGFGVRPDDPVALADEDRQ